MTFGADGRTLVVETRNRDHLFGRLAAAVAGGRDRGR